jgi:hypothetical protein
MQIDVGPCPAGFPHILATMSCLVPRPTSLLTLLAAISVGLGPSRLSAQAPSDATASYSGYFVGFSTRASTGNSLFSTEICGPGPEVGGEVRGGRRLNGWLSLAVSGAMTAELQFDQCENGLHPPPPDSGTVVGAGYPGVAGYPYGTLGLVAVLDERGSAGGASLHLGMEWIPSKDVLALLLGGSGIAGAIGDDVFIEFGGEARALRLPKVVSTVEYRQGQVVSIDRQSSTDWRLRGAVRFGVEVLVGRRGAPG